MKNRSISRLGILFINIVVVFGLYGCGLFAPNLSEDETEILKCALAVRSFYSELEGEQQDDLEDFKLLAANEITWVDEWGGLNQFTIEYSYKNKDGILKQNAKVCYDEPTEFNVYLEKYEVGIFSPGWHSLQVDLYKDLYDYEDIQYYIDRNTLPE